MPRVTIGNREFVYNFKYNTTVSSKYNGRKKQKLVESTECVVRVGEAGSKDSAKTILGTAKVLQKAGELGNRVIARNAALEAAIGKKVSEEEYNELASYIRSPKVAPVADNQPTITKL